MDFDWNKIGSGPKFNALVSALLRQDDHRASRRINSSLGSQWGNTCVAKLDDGVHNALHDIPSPLWIGVGMRVTLTVS
jgi:hypothetical protein